MLSLPTITAVEVSGPRVLHPAEQLVSAAAKAGLPGVGLDWFSLREAERRGVSVEILAESAAAVGLTWTDLSALGLGADATRDQRVAEAMAPALRGSGCPGLWAGDLGSGRQISRRAGRPVR